MTTAQLSPSEQTPRDQSNGVDSVLSLDSALRLVTTERPGVRIDLWNDKIPSAFRVSVTSSPLPTAAFKGILSGILNLINLTAARYVDIKSRKAVINGILDMRRYLLDVDKSMRDTFDMSFVHFISRETKLRSTSKTSSLDVFYVYCGWIHGILSDDLDVASVDSLRSSDFYRELFLLYGRLVDLLYSGSDNLHTKLAKSTAKHVTFLYTRYPGVHLVALDYLLSSPEDYVVALVGSFVSVKPYELRAEDRSRVLALVSSFVVSPKVKCPAYRASVLGGFFEDLTWPECRENVLKNYETAFLRSAETYIPNLSRVVKHVSFDTAELLELLHPYLLKQYQSSNVQYREDALVFWQTISHGCKDATGIVHTMDAIGKSLSTKGDHKSFVYRSIGAFADSRVGAIANQCLEMLIKYLASETAEVNESACLESIARLLVCSPEYRNANFVQSTMAKFLDPKGNRNTFIGGLYRTGAHGMWKECDRDSLLSAVRGFGSVSLKDFGISAFQLAYFWISGASEIEFSDFVADSDSFLVSEKHFHKISALDDQMGLVRLWRLVFERFGTVLEIDTVRWILHCICSYLLVESRRLYTEALALLKWLVANDELTARFNDEIALALCKELSHIAGNFTGEYLSDMVQRSPEISRLLFLVSNCGISNFSTAIVDRFVFLLPVVQHPLFNPNRDVLLWPELVSEAFRKGFQYSPSDIVENRHASLLDVVWQQLELDGVRRQSGIDSLRTLIFISHDVVADSILGKMLNASLVERLQGLCERDILVWSTEEGVLFEDPNDKSDEIVDKNSKDYEMRKWETEVKKEIAQKKGKTEKKLTKEEHAIRAAQLQKESEVRKSVARTCRDLQNFLDILGAVNSSRGQEYDKDMTRIVQFSLRVAACVDKLESSRTKMVGFSYLEELHDCLRSIGRWSQDFALPSVDRVVALLFKKSSITCVPSVFDTASAAQIVNEVCDLIYSFGSEGNSVNEVTFNWLFLAVRYLVDSFGKFSTIELSLETSLDWIARSVDVAALPIVDRGAVMSFLLSVIGKIQPFAKKAQSLLSRFSSLICETVAFSELEVLVDGLLSPAAQVRYACLECLDLMEMTQELAIPFTTRIWICCQDEVDEVAALAHDIWESCEMEIGPSFRKFLLPLLEHHVAAVRMNAGRAIASAMDLYRDSVTDTMHSLYRLYSELIKPAEPILDEFGVVVPESLIAKDSSGARSAIAATIGLSCPFFNDQDVYDCLAFMVHSPGALGDPSESVLKMVIGAALQLIDAHHEAHKDKIIQFLFDSLKEAEENAKDVVCESLVVCLGAAARHLDETDERMAIIVERLLYTLETPSETVQIAVAQGLSALAPRIPTKVEEFKERLLKMALSAETYGARKGGAYGVAGLVRGMGVSFLRTMEIVVRLEEAFGNRKEVHARQGALFIVHSLSQLLGRKFEPFVMQILPHLLSSFGDTASEVREAGSEASAAVSSNLSAYAVKLVLPEVLMGLTDYKWRTKVGSVEFLGSMANLAPRQLSKSLPKIVPRISEVLTDSHKNVREAARKSLERFTDIITNPEIKKMAPLLLEALADPTANTEKALKSLQKASFSNLVDGPSLALVMPIIERGLKERGSDIKIRACRIFGNIAGICNADDIMAYMSIVEPYILEVLIDPVPEARSTAARTFGQLIEQLGERRLPDLMENLYSTMQSQSSSVDRQGAAQGLAEVLHGLGTDRLEMEFKFAVEKCHDPRPFVREGFMFLFTFLPATFGQDFMQYLSRTVDECISALADDYDFVRDGAMNAAKVVVANFGQTSHSILLPRFQKGLEATEWRIRDSAIVLVGDLLYKLSGEKEDEQQEYDGGERGRKAVIKTLGIDTFRSLLSSIYIARCDTSLSVRQAAAHVWKTVVVNTPRTLKEILPLMMEKIVSNLASEDAEKREIAASALSEVAQKVGDAFMGELVPALSQRLESTNSFTREGSCIGLAQILRMASRLSALEYQYQLIEVLKIALIDGVSDVRAAASSLFEALCDVVGSDVIEKLVPDMLLSMGDNPHAFEGLREMIGVKGEVVLPLLLPDLLEPPLTAFKAKALSSLLQVGSEAIIYQMESILPVLISNASNDSVKMEVEDALVSLARNIDLSGELDGVYRIMMLLHELIKENDEAMIAGTCVAVKAVFENVSADLSLHTEDWVKILIGLFDSRIRGSSDIVKEASRAFDSICVKTQKSSLASLIFCYSDAVSLLIEDLDAKEGSVLGIEAFNIPKGIVQIVRMLQYGLINGGSELRQQTIKAVGDVVRFTDVANLRPYVVPLTGPLIRTMGDKFPPAVKVEILNDFRLLLKKVPAFLKPFLPQLQRTLVKALTEPDIGIRRSAASVLGMFISHLPNSDSLVKELEKTYRESEGEILQTVVAAIWQIVDKSGSKLSDNAKQIIENLAVSEDSCSSEVDSVRRRSCILLGSLLPYMSAQQQQKQWDKMTRNLMSASWSECHGALVVLDCFIANRPSALTELSVDLSEMMGSLKRIISRDKSILSESVIVLVGRLLIAGAFDSEMVELLESSLDQESSDLRKMTLSLFATIPSKSSVLDPHCSLLAQKAFAFVRDRNIPVKLAAEKAILGLFRMAEKGNDQFELFLKDLPAPEAKKFSDYYRRVLSKMVQTQRDKPVAESEDILKSPDPKDLMETVDQENDDVLWSKPSL